MVQTRSQSLSLSSNDTLRSACDVPRNNDASMVKVVDDSSITPIEADKSKSNITSSDSFKTVRPRLPLINPRSVTLLASLNVQSLNSLMRRNELTFHASKLRLSALGIQEHRISCGESYCSVDLEKA